MGHSPGIQGENKGLLEHNVLKLVKLIDSRTTEGKDKKLGNMRGFKDDVFSREMHSLKAHKTNYPLACLSMNL